MNALEKEVAALRDRLDKLAERVRVDAVAEAFLADDIRIREGDYFLLNRTFPTKLGNISSEGKWTYFDGRHTIEPFHIPEPQQHTRLYTPVEVAAIVARNAPDYKALAQALVDELLGRSMNINKNESLLRRAREAGLNTEDR